VWRDSRYGDQADIYELDFRTGEEKRVTFDWSDREFAAVSDPWRVWRDVRPRSRITALELSIGPTP
jgi:hypothetical protein